jgi:hypothetical protein
MLEIHQLNDGYKLLFIYFILVSKLIKNQIVIINK